MCKSLHQMTQHQGQQDLYQLLGVTPNASSDEIRTSYRALALKWHPDKNRGNAEAAEKFKSLSAAYAVLSDPSKRAMYDAERSGMGFGLLSSLLSSWSGSSHESGQPGSTDGLGARAAGIAEEWLSGLDAKAVFDSVMAGAEAWAQRGRRMGSNGVNSGGGVSGSESLFRAADLVVKLPLSLEVLLRGGPEKVKYKIRNGRGGERVEVLVIPVQPGWGSGTRVRYSSRGDELKGASRGDVVFEIVEAEHDVYTRVGADVVAQIELTLDEALGKGPITRLLPSLEDPKHKLKVSIQGPVRPGSETRVAGEGMPVLEPGPTGGGQRGDLIVNWNLQWPEKGLGKRQQKLLRSTLLELGVIKVPPKPSTQDPGWTGTLKRGLNRLRARL